MNAFRWVQEIQLYDLILVLCASAHHDSPLFPWNSINGCCIEQSQLPKCIEEYGKLCTCRPSMCAAWRIDILSIYSEKAAVKRMYIKQTKHALHPNIAPDSA